MIGQEKLLEKLNKFTISSLPHSILLLGDEGSGQEEVCKYISDKLKMELIDLTENVTLEYIDQIYLSSVLTLYIINIDKIDEKKQNILLKIFEEPSVYSYFILYGQSDYNLLDTIKNRSYTLQMEKFTKEQLEPLANDKELALKVASTPGQIEICNHTDLKALHKLCETMINKMKDASLLNALSISDKINFKDNYDKFDLDLFIKMLELVLRENVNKQTVEMYNILSTFKKHYKEFVYKRQYFENFIIKLWQASKVN